MELNGVNSTGDPQQSFNSWKSNLLPRYDATVAGRTREEVRRIHLMQKYAARWRESIQNRNLDSTSPSGQLSGCNWLQAMLFNPNSRLSRQVHSLNPSESSIILYNPSIIHLGPS